MQLSPHREASGGAVTRDRGAYSVMEGQPKFFHTVDFMYNMCATERHYYGTHCVHVWKMHFRVITYLPFSVGPPSTPYAP